MFSSRPVGWVRRAWAAQIGPAPDLRAQVFTVTALAGIAISAVTAAVNAANGMGAAQVGLNLLAGAGAAGLLWLVRRTGRYRPAYLVTVAAVFLGLFPLLFFTGGGHGSGMPVFFAFAIAFTALMLEGALFWSLAALEAGVYTACILIAYHRPGWVVPITGRAAMWDSVYAVVAAGATLAVSFHLLLRVYERARGKLAQRNCQLAESYEAKSRFLALAAHELNTPLALIQLHAEEALAPSVTTARMERPVRAATPRDVSPQPSDDAPRGQAETRAEATRKFEVIAVEAARMGRLVGELLDLARIEDGRMRFSIRPEPLGALIQDTLDAYGPVAAAAGATIKVVRGDPNPVVLADRSRITEVLVNLLSNAARHAPGGSITVGVTVRGGRAEVSVTDTGEGMAPETLAGLFEPARTAALKPSGGAGLGLGLGLGLTISRHIVDHHGGEIKAESVLGRGATVSFTLPLAEPEPERRQPGR